MSMPLTPSRALASVPLVLVALVAGACSGGGAKEAGSAVLGEGPDTDGDGLSDSFELAGWDILLDIQGYGAAEDPGLLTARHVTGDPMAVDSDGDGLDDLEEYEKRTDPRDADSDQDQLSDREELVRWGSNPSSADTDGDARGPSGTLVPDVRLFDGQEVATFGTSPTLADTDGDNRSDFVEANDPSLDPRIADLPRAELLVEGEIDVRLNVAYEESQGQEVQYGVSQSTSSTVSTATSTARTHGVESSFSYGFEESVTLFPPSEASLGGSANQQETNTSFNESTTSFTKETAQSAGAEYSRLTVDSRTMTESVSSGSIRMGMRVRNTGNSSFTLSELGVSVLQWVPAGGLGGGSFRTMGTLTPTLSNVTLGPGSQSGILEVSSKDVDPQVIRQVLAHPSSLILQPANFDMQNAEEIDFDFLTENTFTRTALVEVDYGYGEVESWRVATNVERHPDGSLAGARVGDVLSDVLGLPFGDPSSGYAVSPATTSEGDPAGDVLVAVRGRETDTAVGLPPSAFWTVSGSRSGMLAPGGDFQDMRLRAGDQLRLIYTIDADRDGLYAREEQFYGCFDDDPDSDDDGVEDRVEAKFGWRVGEGLSLPGYPRQVFSDPRLADTDGDGLDDFEELTVGTDPSEVDTDADGLSDGDDPFPLIPATRLYVRPGIAGDGLAWETPHADLQEAIADAVERNTGDADPLNDVSEIWVARGVYVPTTGASRHISFALPANVGVYGGFEGTEEKRGARNTDPLTNGTVLSGDLLGNDDGSVEAGAENSLHVVTIDHVGAGVILDGFEVRGGLADGEVASVSTENQGGGIHAVGEALLRNLSLNGNRASSTGGGAFLDGLGEGIRVENCSVTGNRALVGGGLGLAGVGEVSGSRIQGNTAESSGGGVRIAVTTPFVSPGRWTFEGTSIDFGNRANIGGGVSTHDFDVEFVNCDISGNHADTLGGGLYASPASQVASGVRLTNCRLWNNSAGRTGGAVSASLVFSDLSVVNCSIVGNSALSEEVADHAGGLAWTGTAAGSVSVTNSILWGNWRTEVGGAAVFDEAAQLGSHLLTDGVLSDVASTCIEGLASFSGSGNIDDDPSFINEGQGNLRLRANSPCVDAGFDLVDLDPEQPGLQLLGPVDLDGHPRVVDGDDVPGAAVDLGAYERQP